MDPVLLLLLYALVVVAHEALHYLVARASGLKGLRLVFDARLGVVGIRYEEGSRGAVRVSAIAPQLITVLLLLAWLYTSRLEYITAAVLNMVGSLNDFAIFVSPPTGGMPGAAQR